MNPTEPYSTKIEVDPRDLYFSTGLEFTPGQRYEFLAAGKWQYGWTSPCDLNGW